MTLHCFATYKISTDWSGKRKRQDERDRYRYVLLLMEIGRGQDRTIQQCVVLQ